MKSLIPIEKIAEKIYLIRGQKVMLDRDLAELYNVSTKALNQAVKRNLNRFPSDFMFKLTATEKDEVVTICDHLKTLKYSPQLPYVFTEQGVAMLSSVLKSKRAVQINIMIMRAFVKIRELLATHKQVAAKIEQIDKKLLDHDKQLLSIYKVLKQLIDKPKQKIKKNKIGFKP